MALVMSLLLAPPFIKVGDKEGTTVDKYEKCGFLLVMLILECLIDGSIGEIEDFQG